MSRTSQRKPLTADLMTSSYKPSKSQIKAVRPVKETKVPTLSGIKSKKKLG